MRSRSGVSISASLDDRFVRQTHCAPGRRACQLVFATNRQAAQRGRSLQVEMYTLFMRPEDLLRWVESRRAAEQREKLEVRQAGPDTSGAIRSALRWWL
jgi:hypothetical protein